MAEVRGAFTRARGSGEARGVPAQASHPGWPAETGDRIVPDLQIGTTLYELKDIRSDRSHSNYNGAQVIGVEKSGVKIPMEIQKQAVDLDEKMSGVAAPAVGPWQRQLQRAGRGEAAGLRPVRGTRARI